MKSKFNLINSDKSVDALYNIAIQDFNTYYALDQFAQLDVSKDSGKTWNVMPNSPQNIFGLQILNTGNIAQIYVISDFNENVKLYNPVDSSWKTIYKSENGRFVDSLAVSEDGTLYIIELDNDTSNNAQVHVSHNNGQTWSDFGGILRFGDEGFIDHTQISANSQGVMLYFHGILYAVSPDGSVWSLLHGTSSVISMTSDYNYTYVIASSAPNIIQRYNTASNIYDPYFITNIPSSSSSVNLANYDSNLYLMTTSNAQSSSGYYSTSVYDASIGSLNY